MNTRIKLVGTIVIGAVLLAPVAQAERPDDLAGVRGPGGIAALQSGASGHPDNRAELRGPGAIAAQQSGLASPVRPDDRGGSRGPGALGSADVSAARHPDNRAELRGPGALTATSVVESGTSGFDWRDALIGGLGGMGTALLLVGFLFLLMSQKNRTRLA